MEVDTDAGFRSGSHDLLLAHDDARNRQVVTRLHSLFSLSTNSHFLILIIIIILLLL